MKVFLMTSLLGMIAAGIYGTFDASLDVKNGSYIQYQDEPIGTLAAFAGNAKGIHAENPAENVSYKKVVYTENNRRRLSDVSVTDFSLSDIKISDFSRGEPPMIMDELLLNPEPVADSLANIGVSKPGEDILAISGEKAKTKSNPESVTADERKFNLKLFSRGRPPKLTKDESTVLSSDSSKTP